MPRLDALSVVLFSFSVLSRTQVKPKQVLNRDLGIGFVRLYGQVIGQSNYLSLWCSISLSTFCMKSVVHFIWRII
jgi:hypothetical protein